MATGVTVLSQKIARNDLARVFKTPQLIKQFELMSQDVSETLPGAITDQSEAIEDAQATADAALAAANTAQLAADVADAKAVAALAAAGAAQDDVDALALRDVPLALVDAATILVDAEFHNSFFVTLGGNRTLGAPSNLLDGMLLNFAIHQDGTGGRTLAFNAIYDFGAAGTPVMSTTAGAADLVFGYYDALAGKILATFRKAVAAPSTVASFSAHNNGVAQSIATSTFTQLNFSTEAYDVGGLFAASAWTPPAGRPIIMNAAVCFTPASAATFIISIYKNGAEFKRGDRQAQSVAAELDVSVTAQDIPNGTDVYTVRAFQSTGGALNTNGAAVQTYFQGTTIQP